MNEIVKLIASELAAKGKVVEPTANSVMRLLNTHTAEEVNILANKIADKVGVEIGLYRNVFMPVYVSYIEAVNKVLESKKPKNPIHDYKVTVVDIPDYVKHLMSKGTIHANATYVELPVSNVIIPAPKENIRSYFKVASTSEQTYVDELLSIYSDDDLRNIWEKYLLNVSGSNDNIANLPYTDLSNMNDVALLFTLVSNIKTNIPDGVSVNEGTYSKVMRNFYNALVADLAILTRTFNDYVKSKRLVIKLTDTEVKVVKPIYNVFLKEQRVEVLLGLLITGPKNINSLLLNDILVNANNYLNAWEQKVRLTNISMKLEHKNSYKLAYKFAIPLLMEEIADSAKKYVSGTVTELELDVEEYLNTLDSDGVMEIEEVAAFVVPNIVMEESNFYEFLTSMIEYKELDDKLSNKEAASLATLDLIVDYITQQLLVK